MKALAGFRHAGTDVDWILFLDVMMIFAPIIAVFVLIELFAD